MKSLRKIKKTGGSGSVGLIVLLLAAVIIVSAMYGEAFFTALFNLFKGMFSRSAAKTVATVAEILVFTLPVAAAMVIANAKFKIKYAVTYGIITEFMLVMTVLSAAGTLNRSLTGLLSRIAYSVIMALSLNLVVGFLGELSLGHAGFMCVGAYIGCYCANWLSSIIPNQLVVLILTMLIGGVAAALFGFIIGLPALRLKGDYLAIVTLAFGEIVRNIFKNLPWFGKALGLKTTTFQPKTLFVVGFIVVLIVLFMSQNLIRSKHGRAITAIRDNEIAAKAMGVNVTFYKLMVFMISAAFAGVAGVLYGNYTTPVMYSFFSYNYSIEVLVMVVLGGMGSLNGSIIAATLITYVNFKLQSALSGDLAALKLLIYALILILIVLFGNAPALTPIKEKLSIKRFLRNRRERRGRTDVIADDEAAWNRIPTKIPMDEVLSVDVRTEETLPAQDETGEEGETRE